MLNGMRVSAYCTLAVLLLAGSQAAAQPALPEPGRAAFNVFLRSTLIGFEEVEVARTASGWTIRSRGNLSQPVDLQNRLFTIEYDDRWSPRALTIDGTRIGAPLSVNTTFDAATAQIADAVVLPEFFFAAYEAFAARLATIEIGGEFAIFVPPQALARVRLDQVLTRQIETPSAVVDARVHRVSLLSAGRPLSTEVWTDARQRLLRVSIPHVGIDVVRSDIVSVAAQVRGVTHAGDENARVESAGFSLSATVTVPVDRTRPDTGWPAVLLVPGSATTDRDGTVAGIPVLGQLANALADAGYLTMRYDKRGTGQSGGRSESATLQTHADDARALVRYLDRRDDVDRDLIALMGYADGGWVATMVARREGRADQLVLIGTPSGTGDELVMEQQRQALDRLGAGETERAEKITLQRHINAAVLGDGSWDGVPEQMRRQAETPWFRSFLDFDAADTLRRTRQPLLIVRGGSDTDVGAHHAQRLAEAGSRRRREATVDVVTIEGVDHLLIEADPAAPTTRETVSQPAISSSFVGALTAWLERKP